MNRRSIVGACALVALLGGLSSVAGCSDTAKESGTVVQTPPEDLKSMEASAEAYKAMSKQSKK